MFVRLPAATARIFFISGFSDALGFVEMARAQNLPKSISAVSKTTALGHKLRLPKALEKGGIQSHLRRQGILITTQRVGNIKMQGFLDEVSCVNLRQQLESLQLWP